MVTILIADNQLSCEGLRALMEKHPEDFEIKGEASDGMEALSKLEEVKPDILLADLDLMGLDVIELTRRARKASPATKVVINSIKFNEHHMLSALKAGARGYILKTSSFDQLSNALKNVSSGGFYFSNEVSEKLIEYYCRGVHDNTNGSALTSREKEVLLMTKDGMNRTEISRQLNISPRTVEAHRFHAMKKLNLHNQTELFRYYNRDREFAGDGIKA
jgi:two-component system, NarL family, response regulator NreC